jgi:hypothetical protein
MSQEDQPDLQPTAVDRGGVERELPKDGAGATIDPVPRGANGAPSAGIRLWWPPVILLAVAGLGAGVAVAAPLASPDGFGVGALIYFGAAAATAVVLLVPQGKRDG